MYSSRPITTIKSTSERHSKSNAVQLEHVKQNNYCLIYASYKLARSAIFEFRSTWGAENIRRGYPTDKTVPELLYQNAKKFAQNVPIA